MITFRKKADAQPAPEEREENRFEQIRKTAKERHRKSDTGSRDGQTTEDDRLL
jgi:hypothetical protein